MDPLRPLTSTLCAGLTAAQCRDVLCNRGQLASRLARVEDIKVSGGPFHYQIRAGTYGDVYDEAAWKLKLGIGSVKERAGFDNNPLVCQYDGRVLLKNWFEEQRDVRNLKYRNGPKISQFDYMYKSEYATKYGDNLKPEVCNRGRDLSLRYKAFPQTAYPGHQPYLDVPVMLCSFPKPETCISAEDKVRTQQALEQRRRCERSNN